MAAAPAPAPARQARRGPAPIASFDHDGSDESSPESRAAAARLPEIREDAAGALAPPAGRARSLSTPAGALAPAPRIDISRASSSSHQDSRDSSPELALFAGDRAGLELGFREDGALDLRSSTEELAFLEPGAAEPAPRPASAAPAAPAPAPERRHSRKDSQGSEAALLAVSGRTSRLSSVGSQCSALSRASRLSAASAGGRSPSPHRMLLETSFCGPKPIETDPEIGAGALVDRILGLVDEPPPPPAPVPAPTPAPAPAPAPTPAPAPAPAPVDARDRREVRTEVTVESARPPPVSPAAPPAPATPPATPPAPAAAAPAPAPARPRAEERRARPRLRREPSEPEVYKTGNKSKDVIRIRLRPDDSCEEEEPAGEAARKPGSLALGAPARPAPGPPAPVSPARLPAPAPARSPSPAGAPVSRKSSFCSLFKSRETIASPESPSEALRRKRSLTEGRSRSKSRDRSATPTGGAKIRGSVLSLFRTGRRSAAGATSPAPGSPVAPARPPPAARARAADLKYYEDSKDGIIHIPLRTPPDERAAPARRSSGAEPAAAPAPAPPAPRPASAPQPRAPPEPPPAPRAPRAPAPPVTRTVLPDGSIIIPLHSPTETPPATEFPEPGAASPPSPAPAPPPVEEARVSPQRPAVSPPPPAADAAPPGAAAPPAPEAGGVEAQRRRKERLVFTTHVGSREQVFSTQFSITKTPSVTSEISGSFPSFAEPEPPPLRDTRIDPAPEPVPAAGPAPPPAAGSPDPARDSSESEPSSEAAPSRAGNDVEKRVLVVAQESFEEELPYVPTTLPQERPVALPMVPVRDRGGVRVASLQRPRAAAPPARAPAAAPAAPAPAAADKLRIKLPRRPRDPAAPAPRPARPRTRSGSGSGGDTSGGESRCKPEWIDFSEVPERRKQPRRIQTLPAGAGAAGALYSYVEPEQCRCECHARSADHQPALPSSPAENGAPEPAPAGEPGPAAAPAARS